MPSHSFDNLPTETILHITSSLGFSDLANVRLTNRRMADIQSAYGFFDRVYARPISAFLDFVKDIKTKFPDHPLVTGSIHDLTQSMTDFSAFLDSTPLSSDESQVLKRSYSRKIKTLMLHVDLRLVDFGAALQSCLTLIQPQTLILNYLNFSDWGTGDTASRHLTRLPSQDVESIVAILPSAMEAIDRWPGQMVRALIGDTRSSKQLDYDPRPTVDSATVLILDRYNTIEGDEETDRRRRCRYKEFVTSLYAYNPCHRLTIRAADLPGSMNSGLHHEIRHWVERKDFENWMDNFSQKNGFTAPRRRPDLTFETTIGENDVPRVARYSVHRYVNEAPRSRVDPNATTSAD